MNRRTSYIKCKNCGRYILDFERKCIVCGSNIIFQDVNNNQATLKHVSEKIENMPCKANEKPSLPQTAKHESQKKTRRSYGEVVDIAYDIIYPMDPEAELKGNAITSFKVDVSKGPLTWKDISDIDTAKSIDLTQFSDVTSSPAYRQKKEAYIDKSLYSIKFLMIIFTFIFIFFGGLFALMMMF